MPPGATQEVPLEFTEQQDQVVLDLSGYLRMSALATMALGGLGVLTGLVIWFWLWQSFWGGLFAIVVGGATKFLGLVLLSASSDMRYVADTKGYDKIHLMNALTSINFYLKVQIAVAALVGVVLFFRLLP